MRQTHRVDFGVCELREDILARRATAHRHVWVLLYTTAKFSTAVYLTTVAAVVQGSQTKRPAYKIWLF